MEKLTPITEVAIPLHSPMTIPPPDIQAVFNAIAQEARSFREDGYDVVEESQSFWESSLTTEEKNYYAELKRQAAQARKRRDAETVDTEEGDEDDEADFSSSTILWRGAEARIYTFQETAGQHLCHECSHFVYADQYDPHSVSCCDRGKRFLATRPCALACSHFTTGETPEQRKEYMQRKMYYSRHPKEAEEERRRLRKKNAINFADEMKAAHNDIAFLLCSDNIKYYLGLYDDFPKIFKDTPFPTKEDLLTAFKKWKESKTTNATINNKD